MNGLLGLNLIHLLDFYLLVFFFVGTWRRIGQYRNIGKLAIAGPGRWPHLLKLMNEHRTIFMTWATVAPALLALGLTVLQLLASRLIWPEAGRPPYGLNLGRLLEHWPALFVVAPLGLAMLAMDLYTVLFVAEVPRQEMEKYFDQAEYWLRSRTAHVVRAVTFGFINPRKMVANEVQKALVEASSLLNRSLWWVSMQTGLRFSFGLSLWLTWALTL
ncbi:MAG: hypothetical protein L0215_26665 [Gemmataceae bacterium]|nr:hypothetical protein [Gemmataceae bacterium]